MTTEDLVKMVVEAISANPDLLGSLTEHPYSTVQKVTGQTGEIDRSVISEVIAAVYAIATGQNVDFGSLAKIATKLLGQNGNSAHTMAESLLGAVAQQTSSRTPETPQEDAILANLSNVLFGSGQAQGAGHKVDLSDGFDFGDALGLFEMFMGGSQK